MGLINWAPPGEWSLYSPTDPRWNCHGAAESICLGSTPREAEAALAALKEKYGEPPADLMLSQMKD